MIFKDSALPYYPVPGAEPGTCSRCGADGQTICVHTFQDKFPALCTSCWLAYDQERRVAEDQDVELDTPPWPACQLLDDRDKKVLDLDLWVTAQLKRIGLSTEETRADLLRIQGRLLKALPLSWLETLRTGVIPMDSGIGIVDTSGTGKSMALAALLRLLVTNNRRVLGPIKGLTDVKGILWVSWNRTVTTWRLDPLEKTIADKVDRMCKVPMLVLDDLAREQKKDFDTDRCCAALDLIVSTRDAEHRPIWWTSNLQGAALDDRYGVALMRRLRRLNPELGPLGLNIMQ